MKQPRSQGFSLEIRRGGPSNFKGKALGTRLVMKGLLMALSIIMKNYLLPGNVPISRQECKKHVLFMTKIAKTFDTLGA